MCQVPFCIAGCESLMLHLLGEITDHCSHVLFISVNTVDLYTCSPFCKLMESVVLHEKITGTHFLSKYFFMLDVGTL